MKSKTTTIIVTVIVITLLAWALIYANKKSNAPGPLDGFAKCLKDVGLKFYGAFWCPHCQSEKKLFGNSAKLIPYIECSNADQSQKQTCIDEKIEGYPTWEYSKEISIESATAPITCEKENKEGDCAQIGSQFYKVWLFPNIKILAGEEPKHEGTIYTFPAGTRSSGEISLENLAKFSSCQLPEAAK